MRINQNLEFCLLGILQRAITESRTMALSGEAKKASYLLDALDNIPRHLANWHQYSKLEIQEQLNVFMKQYPDHHTNYAKIIETEESLL